MDRKEMKAKQKYFNAVQYNKGDKVKLENKVRKKMEKRKKQDIRENVKKVRKDN